MEFALTSGSVGLAEQGVRRHHLHGEVGAQKDAQEPVRSYPHRDSLDTTERAHGDCPELNTRREGLSFATNRCLTGIANIRFTDCVNFGRICVEDR